MFARATLKYIFIQKKLIYLKVFLFYFLHNQVLKRGRQKRKKKTKQN